VPACHYPVSCVGKDEHNLATVKVLTINVQFNDALTIITKTHSCYDTVKCMCAGWKYVYNFTALQQF